MAIGDLFKSKSEREKDAARKRRQAFRQAESSVDAVNDRIKGMKRTRDKAWADALQNKKTGNKTAAQRALLTYRATEQMIVKLEQKKWTFDQLLTKLDLAKTDQEFAGALNALNAVVNIDPETVANVLDEVQDKLGEQMDVDKVWNKVTEKETEGVLDQESELVPSMEELEAQLDAEAAVEIGGGHNALDQAEASSGASMKNQIDEGRDRLKKLLGNDK